jgi:hypothetical protein
MDFHVHEKKGEKQEKTEKTALEAFTPRRSRQSV